MKLRDLVGGAATLCGPDLTVAEAARVMIDQGIGSLGVMDSGRLVGIMTERDVLRAVAEGADLVGTSVETAMTPDPDEFEPEVEVGDAANWILATGYRHLPVVEDGHLLGILSIKDVLWALAEEESEVP